MSDVVMKIILETVQISLLVLVMMIAVDLVIAWADANQTKGAVQHETHEYFRGFDFHP